MPWSDGDDLSPTNLNYKGSGPVFNVRAYGATGDGSTDDAAAIQSAIDAAEVNGGTVWFPSSNSEVYSLGTTLNVKSQLPVNLKGDMVVSHHDTYAGPYLEPQAQLTNGMVKYQSPTASRGACGGGTIEGLVFADSSDRSWSVGEGALNLIDFDLSGVRNCRFIHLNGSAISADRMIQSYIENCHVVYCGNSTDPAVRLGTDSGDATNIAQALTMQNCRLEVNAGTYVYIEDAQASIQITDCFFESDSQVSSEHTYIWSKGDKVKISNCNFNRNKKAHVHFDSASGGENILTDCTFASSCVEPRVTVSCQRTILDGLMMHGSLATQTEISVTGNINTLSDILCSRCGNVEVTGQLCTVNDLYIYDPDTSETSVFVLGQAGIANNVRIDTTLAGTSAYSLVGTAKILNLTTRNLAGASDGAAVVSNVALSSADTISFIGPQIEITNTTPLSLATAANFNDMNNHDLRLVFTSSGLSLGYSSGTTLYDLQSNTSAVQPTS